MGGSNISIIIAIWVIGLSFIGFIFFIFCKYGKKKTNGELKEMKSANHRNYLMWLYRFYKTTPFFDKYFIRTRKKVEIIYPADSVSINRKTTQILLKGTLVGIVGIIVTFVVGNGDIYFILSGLMTTYLLLTTSVNSSFTSMELKLLKQMAEMLNKVRHFYHDSRIVETALSLTLEDLPYEISLHMQNIYNMIISPKMKYEIDNYIGTEPNKYMLMFVSICSSIKEFGDKTLEDGTSLFLTDLNYLKEEINNEMIAVRKNQQAFSFLPAIAIAPVLAVKGLEWWAKSIIPEIALMYDGMYGKISILVIFAVSFIIYNIIITLRDGEKTIEKDSDLFSRLASSESVSPILNRIVSKNYTKYMRYDDAQRGMGNHTGPKAFALKRFLLAAIAIIATIITLSFINVGQKIVLLQEWTTELDKTVIPTRYKESMLEMGGDYVRQFKNKSVTVKEMTAYIMDNTELTRESYATILAKQIVSKINSYQNVYFRWYYLLIALALGYIAYMFPVWNLIFKKKIIDSRKEEEVIQFQSLMLILMHINGTTLPIILEWMERFSYSFKASITECRINIYNGQQKALIDMRDGERFGPFRDFVDNLLSIDKVGVENAFDEIQTDREYYLKKREQDREESIRNKSTIATLLSFLPVSVTLMLYLIIPIIYYANSMMQNVTSLM